jgi:sporulation protein YlmC with PRC-barrel domain
MRASDLLESRVYDADGEDIGQVHDIRMVREGPVQGMFGPGYRVLGLIVGPAGVGVRLGFDRSSMHGPWALKALFRWAQRNARLVEWSLIDSIEQDAIRLRVPERELPPVPNR